MPGDASLGAVFLILQLGDDAVGLGDSLRHRQNEFRPALDDETNLAVQADANGVELMRNAAKTNLIFALEFIQRLLPGTQIAEKATLGIAG